MSIASASLPHEACAVVSGRRERVGETHGGAGSAPDETNQVLAVHPVANSLKSPTRFALDGVEMMAAEEAIDDAGHELIGVLHSHPTSWAYPSHRDLADAAIYDPQGELIQVIVSLQGCTASVRAFRYLGKGAPLEVELIACK